MTTSAPAEIVHWVDGSPLTGSPTGWADVTNPATGQVTGRVALASEADAAHVIAAASRAARSWGTTSLARRTQVVFAFRELLNARKDELAAIITAEHGKVHSDALGEVARGLEVVEFACGISAPAQGRPQRGGLDRRRRALQARQPLGVVGHHQPLQLPGDGADVVLPASPSPPATPSCSSPARRTRRAAIWIAALWQEAGLPDGVFNVLQGDKDAVDALLDQPRRAGDQLRRLHPDRASTSTRPRAGTASASRPSAAPRTTWSCCPTPTSTSPPTRRSTPATARAGERCMAISVLVAVGPIGDELVARIADRTRTLLIGDGGREATGGEGGRHGSARHEGPPRQGRVVRRLRRGRRREGGRRRPRRRRPTAASEGFWLGPTLFDHVTPDMDVYTRGDLRPRAVAWSASTTYEEAVALVNANQYGNGTAIFTNDGGAARRSRPT